MDGQWFFKRSGGIVGPVDIAEIRYCIQKGIITPESDVREGTGPWQEARYLVNRKIACPKCNKTYQVSDAQQHISFCCIGCGNQIVKAQAVRENSSDAIAGRRKAIPERVRHAVWRRDEGKCVDCGSRESLEYDHIIPFSKGGSNTERNLELRCEKCNRRKSNKI